MKAAVIHEYGAPSRLKYEDFPDPKPGSGEVLVRVTAASVNPVDWKMRSGAAKDRFPVEFPAVLGRDCAGTVAALGEDVSGFTVGDRVFALTWHTYAELCIVNAEDLAKVPEGLDLTTAAAVPLVSVTGDQLIGIAASVQSGQTILLTGALGSVGRMALFCALENGAKVIAGVRKNQKEEALALGATAAVDLADSDDLARLGFVDAVADTIGGKLAPTLLAHIKPGGIYASIVGPPQDAALHPTIQIKPYMAHPDAKTIVHYAEAIQSGKLKLPIDLILPLSEAAEAHTKGEKGGIGKIILTA